MARIDAVQPPSRTSLGVRWKVLPCVLSGLLLATCGVAWSASPAEIEYAHAVQDFRAGRISPAFGQFVELANRGDVDSARIALFMHSYGPVLYGKQWDAMPADVAYWAQLVRNSGTSARPMPEFAPTVLNPTKPKVRTASNKATPIKNVSGTAN